MDRQKAIKIIEEWCDNGTHDFIHEALQMAIKALKREQAILNSGYIGKEIDFHIGGRLFSFREKAQ